MPIAQRDSSAIRKVARRLYLGKLTVSLVPILRRIVITLSAETDAADPASLMAIASLAGTAAGVRSMEKVAGVVSQFLLHEREVSSANEKPT